MPRLKGRPIFLRFHRYLGLIAGLLFVLLGITGSLLVFTEEIDQFFHPHLLRVEPQGQLISPQQALITAQAQYPDLTLHRLIAPQRPDQVYTVMLESASEGYRDVYVDSYTGQALGSRPWKASLGGFLIDLHVHLLSGEGGMMIVGLTGLGFLAMTITGLMLWNGWHNLKSTLKIRWQSAPHLKIFDLHKIIGVTATLGLLVTAFTGSAMIFWTPFEKAVYTLTGEAQPADVEIRSQPGANPTPLSLDPLVAKALTEFPQAKLWKAFPAKKPEDAVNLWLVVPQENAFNKDISIFFDQYSGAILQVKNAKTASLAIRILEAQYILHIGHFGGWLTRFIYVLIGLIPALLLITGLLMFQRRRWRWIKRKAYPF